MKCNLIDWLDKNVQISQQLQDDKTVRPDKEMKKEDATPEVPVIVGVDKQLKSDAEMTNQELPDGVNEKFAI